MTNFLKRMIVRIVLLAMIPLAPILWLLALPWVFLYGDLRAHKQDIKDMLFSREGWAEILVCFVTGGPA